MEGQRVTHRSRPPLSNVSLHHEHPILTVLRFLESISDGLGIRIPCVPGENSFSKAGSFFPPCFSKGVLPAWVADAALGCWVSDDSTTIKSCLVVN